MSLNDLPTQLTIQIISHLADLEKTDPQLPTRPRTSISRYAGTSMNIRDAVEQRTFSALSITSDDLPAFEKLVTGSRSRRTLLRHLTFEPILPTYSENACARYETPTDKARNNESFSASIVRLSALLVPCDDTEKAAPLRLSLTTPYSPTDDLSNARFTHSYLYLDFSTDFPTLNRVSQFVATNNGTRYMAPGPVFSLLGHMPHVGDLVLQLHDNEKKISGLRKQLRNGFGETLSSVRCSMLKTLHLDFLFEEPSDHRFMGPDMRVDHGETRHDSFSLGLKHFISSCPSLIRVRLSGPICADETLFWSPESCTDDA